MRTLLYLVRHAATAANLAVPAFLQGRGIDPPLAPEGIRQALLTRDFLAIRPIDVCYSSPLKRARQTAQIIAEPHGLTPKSVADLTECDVGRWEGISWEQIKADEPEAYRQFHDDPTKFGYPDGETFAEVHKRAAAAIDDILTRHAGQAVLVVSHHVVNRTFLAGVLGIPIKRAKQVALDNCGVSVVVREGNKLRVATLNAAFHLAAA